MFFQIARDNILSFINGMYYPRYDICEKNNVI